MPASKDIYWHDATIAKVDLLGRPVLISLKDRNGAYEVSFANVDKAIIDKSEDWGPSEQILSLNKNNHEVTIQMQNGTLLQLSGCKPIEIKTQNKNKL